MRAQERLLQRVLAVLAAAEHVATEREQRRAMAGVEDLERGGVAATGEGRELHVVEPCQRSKDAELGHLAPRTPDTRRYSASTDQLGPGRRGLSRITTHTPERTPT